MGNYNFNKDLPIAHKTEEDIATILCERGNTVLGANNDAAYDLKVQNYDGHVLKIEIKEDFKSEETGNMVIEFECRGKRSGILNTKADYYIYKINSTKSEYYAASVESIKDMIIAMRYKRVVVGGDKGSNTKMYLIDLNEFKRVARKL